MPQTTSILERVAGSLPDIPRWLETRSMLLSNRCEVLGFKEASPEVSFVARELEECEDRLICLVGRPSTDAIEEAVKRGQNPGLVLAAPEGISYIYDALPGWSATRATLHRIGSSRLPQVAGGEVRRFRASDLAAVAHTLPEELRLELESALTRGAPVAAALADSRLVSFCHAGEQTEGLWDISIDTLEPYRRQGYAARCVAYMVDEMRRRGKEPVWAAEETNPPSMRLAAKLGFVPVDELVLFRPTAST